MIPRTHIMVHHSLTKDGEAVSWGAIEHYHRVVNGWTDIGYHAGVENVGGGFYALIGRPLEAIAAACPQGGMNSKALHVCCVGNFDEEAPSPLMLDVLLRRIIRPWMRRFSIPAMNIVGHHDYNAGKSCPGALFDLAALRSKA